MKNKNKSLIIEKAIHVSATTDTRNETFSKLVSNSKSNLM